MILADTSVWVDHFRRTDRRLVESLDAAEVLIHPFIVGELACGRIRDRHTVLRLLSRLPQSPVATDQEALAFLEGWRLMGRGMGWIDVHLLASVALGNGLRLWTRDRRLAKAASELELTLD